MLLGIAEPGGRLPVAIPRRREDLTIIDWHARRVRYPRLWGQRRLDHDGVDAAYPFGFGLGYSSMRVESAARVAGSVQVRVSNVGQREGRHVVQVYAGSALAGFAVVAVPAGETVVASVSCHAEGTLRVGSYAGDPASVVV